MKVGDKVWVLCEVKQALPDGFQVKGCSGGISFWVLADYCRPVEHESNSPKILDSSSHAAGDWRPSKDEIEYAKDRCGVPASDTLAPSPCMDGVDADQFIEGIIKARGRTADLQVGDAVRFVSPGHKRHGTEGILKSIHHGPRNAYRFDSNCGQFHRYCTITELERIIKRHRTPTPADLRDGPIECEYRDDEDEQWRSGLLVYILNGSRPFLCTDKEEQLSGQWDQCRIEVGE